MHRVLRMLAFRIAKLFPVEYGWISWILSTNLSMAIPISREAEASFQRDEAFLQVVTESKGHKMPSKTRTSLYGMPVLSRLS